MSTNRIADYLDHIEQAARDACAFASGLSKQQFLADRRTQYASLWCFVIIGEAASKLIDDHGVFITEHPHLPWKDMKGMRNRLAHGYFDVNLDIVWEAIQTSLPDLLAQIPGVRAAVSSAPGQQAPES